MQYNSRPTTKHLNMTTPTHHTRTFLRPFFGDHLGEPVPEENFWTLRCKGRLTEADTPTIRLGATPSGLTSAHLHHPSIFLQAGVVTTRDRRRNVDIMNKLAIDRDVVELLHVYVDWHILVTCLECSLRDIHTFFIMDISLEVDLKEDPGNSWLTISRKTVLFWGLHLSMLQDLHRTEVSGGS